MNAVPRGFPFVTFDNAPLWQSQKIFLAANLLGYLITLCVPHSHVHVDLLGTGAFAVAALPSLLQRVPALGRPLAAADEALSSTPALLRGWQLQSNPRIRISATVVVAWSAKLAAFLFYRILQAADGRDGRLEGVLASPASAAGFWLFSCGWGCLCSLPHTLGSTSSSSEQRGFLVTGAALAGLGWLVETLSDYQKWTFKRRQQTSRDTCCREGLWALSQHPNWCGNLLLWCGVWLMNAPALVEPVMVRPARAAALSTRLWSYRRLLLSLASPAFLAYTFWGQATGRLLPEAHAATLKRYGYGTDPDYTAYVDGTPLIVPNPLQWWRSGSTDPIVKERRSEVQQKAEQDAKD